MSTGEKAGPLDFGNLFFSGSTLFLEDLLVEIWQGIFEQFSDVPTVGDAFSGKHWAERSKQSLANCRGYSQSSMMAPAPLDFSESLLATVVALLQAELHAPQLTILDFGGGLGITYSKVIASLAKKDSIDFHVVERENICRLGQEVFREDSQISFHQCMPTLESADLVHVGSALQYVEDWKSVITKLGDYGPRYWLFTDLPAGDIPTYASGQRYYESTIPCWFFNISDILSQMRKESFCLLFRSTFNGAILGVRQGYPQANFPEKYRLGHSCNLLFSRQ